MGRPQRLTDVQVAEIRASKDSPASLSKQYGVSKVTIWKVKTFRPPYHVIELTEQSLEDAVIEMIQNESN